MKITICGSIGFYQEMEAMRDKLSQRGHEVKIPELALEVSEEMGGGKKIHFGDPDTNEIKDKEIIGFCVIYNKFSLELLQLDYPYVYMHFPPTTKSGI